MSSQDTAIAVGSAGSATGLGALRALRAWKSPVRLLACDTNPKHMIAAASEFDALKVSTANADGFSEILAQQLATRAFTAFYPIHDAEVAVASAKSSHFEALGITVLAAASDAVSLARDKLRMAARFEETDVPGPATNLATTATWQGQSLHYKPRTGVGSHGTGTLLSAEDLARLQSSDAADDLIVQPFINGMEVTIDAFCPAPGETLACICRERLEVKAGVSTKARLFVDPDLTSLTGRVSQALGLTGAFCYQVRGTADTDWQVIDVNPRVGGGTPLSVAAGYNFPCAHAAHFLGHDPSAFFRAPPKKNIFVVRSFQEHVTCPVDP